MVFRMLAVLSEFERDQISERTSAAMVYKKAQGERVGELPYGYQAGSDGKLVENASEEVPVNPGTLKRWLDKAKQAGVF